MNCSVAHKTVFPEGHTVSNLRMRRSTGFMCFATKVDSSQKAQIQHKETQNLLRPYCHDTHPSLKIKCLKFEKVMESKASVALRDTSVRVQILQQKFFNGCFHKSVHHSSYHSCQWQIHQISFSKLKLAKQNRIFSVLGGSKLTTIVII